MKLDKWEDLTDQKFTWLKKPERQPLAFYEKNSAPTINCPESFVIYEENGKLYIGNSDRKNPQIPFTILSKLINP